MARQPRLEVPNGIYHATARGNARGRIYRDDTDRRSFLAVLEKTLARHGWRCLGYCLMGNHFHLVVRTPEPNLSRGMQYLGSVYTQMFNRRHNRSGHLQQGRFSSVLVERDRHMLETIRYVVRNPIKARLCKLPDEWAWSSHGEMVGSTEQSVVAVDEVLTFFCDGPAPPIEQYRAFVELDDGVAGPPRNRVVQGSLEFQERHLADVPRSPEFPRISPDRLSLEEIFATGDVDAAIAAAHLEHHYPMVQIARQLGCHYSTVSRRLKAIEMQGNARGKT